MASGPAEIASRVISLPVSTMIVAVAVLLLLLLLQRRRSQKDPVKRYLISDPPRDTVILHQYGNGYTVPSISPFVMKLETYLKVAKIPYINKYSRQPGPKGKLPWIQYNDQVISDSQFCIEFLNREMKIDLNKHLKPDQLAIGHLVRRTAEESLYWGMITWRLMLEKTGLVYRKLGLPSAVVWYLRRAARPGLRSQGIGRHSQQEVMQMMQDDLQALSQILGERHFLFGDKLSEVTEFDCALFGQLCQLVWQMPGTPVERTIAERYPNLVVFCERMKSAFWRDWEDRILHGSDTSNTKCASTILDGPAQFHQLSTSGKNDTAPSMVTNVSSKRFTSLLPGRASSVSDSVVTGRAPLLSRSDGKENIMKTPVKGKCVQRVWNNQSSQSENKTTAARTSKVTAASILANKPSLCLQQQYYHDMMTF